MIAAPLAASAQTATTVRRISTLTAGAGPTQADLEAINAPLRALGWVEGQNLLVERRNANDRAELLRPFAEELVRLELEIIVTGGTAATLAAKNATTTIPIIIYTVGDPAAAVSSRAWPGLANNLAHAKRTPLFAGIETWPDGQCQIAHQRSIRSTARAYRPRGPY